MRGTAYILLPKQGLINDYEQKEIEEIGHSHKKAESITDFSAIVAQALIESKKKTLENQQSIMEKSINFLKNNEFLA